VHSVFPPPRCAIVQATHSSYGVIEGGNLNEAFRRFARYTSDLLGSSGAFGAAVIIVLIWGLTGPYFGYSDAWQLAINTGTTIVTFLMVFLIQNTQNRDSRATHLKLDELIKAVRGARNSMIDLDRLTDEELRELEAQYKSLCDRHIKRSDDSKR
jgi:low affinity Fe/Cu permease